MLIEGGAFLYPADPVAELWHTHDDDCGDTYTPEIYRTPATVAAAAAAKKCGCGNFKSANAVDGLCNACRTSGSNSKANTTNTTTTSTTTTGSSSSTTAQPPVGTKRKADEQLKSGGVVDLTGDDV
jgi:hypothetical protein